ncbi:hypothetical protein N7517_007299 [Penicillium concentricum]|uniref:Rhodopsin domain-containing protein n=1 Tax=Penicillium concentricum TaxID=293559 RepID=A0A9W9VAT0_9EURO|nr:uncharacterized protein N7517_007299 [Penicillium concentricum]KAJ5375293.1 hypothetical protein N7517_007299 [Penicillium concentricum]
MNGFHVSLGTGRHLSDLPLEEVLIPTLKHWYVYQLVYPLSVGMVKFSILAQYYRIFALKQFRIATIGVGLFVFAYTVICIFVNAFECHTKPWRAWDPSFPEGCNNLSMTYFSTAGINILTDIVILIMPLPQLMKLNLRTRRKSTDALIAILLTGTFASVASIIRLNALYKYTITKDVSYDAIQILIWSQVEVNVAIISASAPSLRPLFNNTFKDSSYARSYGQVPYHGPSWTPHGYDTATSQTLRPEDDRAIEMWKIGDGDEGGPIDGSSSRMVPSHTDRHNSQELMLEPGSNIMKTVVIEMKSERGD